MQGTVEDIYIKHSLCDLRFYDKIQSTVYRIVSTKNIMAEQNNYKYKLSVLGKCFYPEVLKRMEKRWK